MKKFLAGLMAFSFLALNALPVFAAVNLADVGQNYWARKEIVDVVENNIMTVNSSNCFAPEKSMTRVEFVNALLKILTNDNLDVKIQNQFKDVASSNPNYDNILRSQQLGLVYGYPDKTFQPNRVMLRSEAQSVISHITKDAAADTSVLAQFKDAASVPAWAKGVYAKTLAYGIYVNYPDSRELRPNDALTRAEAAVLLARLKDRLGLVKKEYLGPEAIVAVEHLPKVSKKVTNDIVNITNRQNIITKDNVLLVSFDEKFKQKVSQAGEEVVFVAPENICTVEGTLLIPANSKFTGKILNIQDPKWFNKNGRVFVQINKLQLPSGDEVAFNAKPFYKNYELKEGPWMTAGKLLLCTVTGGAVGTGAGVGFAFIPDPTKIGTGIAIGAPVGAAVGLVTGLVTPGLNYNAKKGEEIKVILLEDAGIVKQAL